MHHLWRMICSSGMLCPILYPVFDCCRCTFNLLGSPLQRVLYFTLSFLRHFTIRGAEGTDFEGGIYHGRILLPPEYPFKPPHIILLTPSGRFETNTKVCLSFSAYHPELWQPAWGIRLILEALISFLPTPADGAVGALDWSSTERKRLAAKSVHYMCPTCGNTANLLPKIDESKKKESTEKSIFQKEIEKLHLLQMQEHKQEVGEEGGDKQAAAQKDEAAGTEEGKPKAVEENAVEDNGQGKPQAVEEIAVEDNGQGKPRESSAKIDQSEVPALAEEEKVQVQEQKQDDKPQALGVDERAGAPLRQVPDVAVAQAPPAAVENVNVGPHDEGSSWLMDPALQASIAILAAICFILLRKVNALLDDLRALE
jgi:ubiquitin-conjugating enzyme E2 J1